MNIHVSQPYLGLNESKNVNKALNETAISGFYGEFIPKFEKGFAEYSDCKFGVTTTSGTTALHLAIAALGLTKGDEVLVSTLTNMATFFAVLYSGAIPIPIDIKNDTLNINPNLLEDKINKKTKAIIVVHLFGHPVDMEPVVKISKKYNLFLIEDCAQAHGATYKGQKVGSFGDIGCFSFYANKIITTGEGGMITTNNEDIAVKASTLKSLAFGVNNKFMHKDIGYNYRMTNLQAAIGCGQLKKINEIIELKRNIAEYYSNKFQDLDFVQLPLEKPYVKSVFWMYHIVLKDKLMHKRNEIMKDLKQNGIETREGFIPYNMQEIFINRGWVKMEACPRANKVAFSSFYLPSGPSLSAEELEYISEKFIKIITAFN